MPGGRNTERGPYGQSTIKQSSQLVGKNGETGLPRWISEHTSVGDRCTEEKNKGFNIPALSAPPKWRLEVDDVYVRSRSHGVTGRALNGGLLETIIGNYCDSGVSRGKVRCNMMKMNKETKKEVIAQFEKAMSYEEIKKSYVERITEFRGNKAAINFINGAFEKYVDEVKDIHVNKKGETYQKEVSESTEGFINLINELIGMDGIIVESCGTWLWVSGATKEHKEALKACGFRFAAKKKMWYKAPEGTKHYRGKKTWKMSQIREVYGSKVIEDAEEIA